ncbi:tetratricopeptide repeat protein [Pontiella sp.]|uniref:tetratricopeptide repeat protein n=1 Tax=Pontiella sp. TaxID=2837462 RepID=UPI0035616461
MKPLLIILTACSTLLATAQAAELSLSEKYLKAQTAYDDARYAEAAMIYEAMVNDGVANSEVHFNLANANFKDGHLPLAVWHYRKAWYESPRDPDIKANLHFALNAAGAIDPAPGFVARIFETLSIGEWIAAAVAGYLLLAAALILCLLVPSIRRALLKFCLAPAALILVSAGGWWQWHQLELHPEWVVVKTEATALYSPVEGTTAHYKLPLGALARQTGSDPKGWIEVEYDGKRGWLKAGFISRVSP